MILTKLVSLRPNTTSLLQGTNRLSWVCETLTDLVDILLLRPCPRVCIVEDSLVMYDNCRGRVSIDRLQWDPSIRAPLNYINLTLLVISRGTVSTQEIWYIFPQWEPSMRAPLKFINLTLIQWTPQRGLTELYIFPVEPLNEDSPEL